jgi:hypothetical protein
MGYPWLSGTISASKGMFCPNGDPPNSEVSKRQRLRKWNLPNATSHIGIGAAARFKIGAQVTPMYGAIQSPAFWRANPRSEVSKVLLVKWGR